MQRRQKKQMNKPGLIMQTSDINGQNVSVFRLAVRALISAIGEHRWDDAFKLLPCVVFRMARDVPFDFFWRITDVVTRNATGVSVCLRKQLLRDLCLMKVRAHEVVLDSLSQDLQTANDSDIDDLIEMLQDFRKQDYLIHGDKKRLKTISEGYNGQILYNRWKNGQCQNELQLSELQDGTESNSHTSDTDWLIVHEIFGNQESTTGKKNQVLAKQAHFAMKNSISNLKEPCEWLMECYLHLENELYGTETAVNMLEVYKKKNPDHLPAHRLSYYYFKNYVPDSEENQLKELKEIARMCPDDPLVLELVDVILKNNDQIECESQIQQRGRDSFLEKADTVENHHCSLNSSKTVSALGTCLNLVTTMLEYKEFAWKLQPWQRLSYIIQRFYMAWIRCWKCSMCKKSRKLAYKVAERVTSLWRYCVWIPVSGLLSYEKAQVIFHHAYAAHVFCYSIGYILETIKTLHRSGYHSLAVELKHSLSYPGPFLKKFNAYSGIKRQRLAELGIEKKGTIQHSIENYIGLLRNLSFEDEDCDSTEGKVKCNNNIGKNNLQPQYSVPLVTDLKVNGNVSFDEQDILLTSTQVRREIPMPLEPSRVALNPALNCSFAEFMQNRVGQAHFTNSGQMESAVKNNDPPIEQREKPQEKGTQIKVRREEIDSQNINEMGGIYVLQHEEGNVYKKEKVSISKSKKNVEEEFSKQQRLPLHYAGITQRLHFEPQDCDDISVDEDRSELINKIEPIDENYRDDKIFSNSKREKLGQDKTKSEPESLISQCLTSPDHEHQNRDLDMNFDEDSTYDPLTHYTCSYSAQSETPWKESVSSDDYETANQASRDLERECSDISGITRSPHTQTRETHTDITSNKATNCNDCEMNLIHECHQANSCGQKYDISGHKAECSQGQEGSLSPGCVTSGREDNVCSQDRNIPLSTNMDPDVCSPSMSETFLSCNTFVAQSISQLHNKFTFNGTYIVPETQSQSIKEEASQQLDKTLQSQMSMISSHFKNQVKDEAYSEDNSDDKDENNCSSDVTETSDQMESGFATTQFSLTSAQQVPLNDMQNTHNFCSSVYIINDTDNDKICKIEGEICPHDEPIEPQIHKHHNIGNLVDRSRTESASKSVVLEHKPNSNQSHLLVTTNRMKRFVNDDDTSEFNSKECALENLCIPPVSKGAQNEFSDDEEFIGVTQEEVVTATPQSHLFYHKKSCKTFLSESFVSDSTSENETDNALDDLYTSLPAMQESKLKHSVYSPRTSMPEGIQTVTLSSVLPYMKEDLELLSQPFNGDCIDCKEHSPEEFGVVDTFLHHPEAKNDCTAMVKLELEHISSIKSNRKKNGNCESQGIRANSKTGVSIFQNEEETKEDNNIIYKTTCTLLETKERKTLLETKERKKRKRKAEYNHSVLEKKRKIESNHAVLEKKRKADSNKSVLEKKRKADSNKSVLEKKRKADSNKSVLEKKRKADSNKSVLEKKRKADSNKSVLEKKSKADSNISGFEKKRKPKPNHSVLEKKRKIKSIHSVLEKKRQVDSNKSVLEKKRKADSNHLVLENKRQADSNKSVLEKKRKADSNHLVLENKRQADSNHLVLENKRQADSNKSVLEKKRKADSNHLVLENKRQADSNKSVLEKNRKADSNHLVLENKRQADSNHLVLENKRQADSNKSVLEKKRKADSNHLVLENKRQADSNHLVLENKRQADSNKSVLEKKRKADSNHLVLENKRQADSNKSVLEKKRKADSNKSVLEKKRKADSNHLVLENKRQADSNKSVLEKKRKADSNKSVLEKKRKADSNKSVLEKKRKADSNISGFEKKRKPKPNHSVLEKKRQADSNHLVLEKKRQADSNHLVLEKKRQADSNHLVLENKRQADSNHLVLENKRLADSNKSVLEKKRKADSNHLVLENKRQVDSNHLVLEKKRQADSNQSVLEKKRKADSNKSVLEKKSKADSNKSGFEKKRKPKPNHSVLEKKRQADSNHLVLENKRQADSNHLVLENKRQADSNHLVLETKRKADSNKSVLEKKTTTRSSHLMLEEWDNFMDDLPIPIFDGTEEKTGRNDLPVHPDVTENFKGKSYDNSNIYTVPKNATKKDHQVLQKEEDILSLCKELPFPDFLDDINPSESDPCKTKQKRRKGKLGQLPNENNTLHLGSFEVDDGSFISQKKPKKQKPIEGKVQKRHESGLCLLTEVSYVFESKPKKRKISRSGSKNNFVGLNNED
ncbi:uncharacterized protein LOC121857813 isoform X1 [Homarus americanus]|nr:uncharacterized protein LOC121857813 isoform X1 [Homarus americanus]